MAETSKLEVREKQELEGEGTRPGPIFRPDVDILERKDGYVIFADLPGADDKSVDIRLEKGTLTLTAQLATMPDSSWTQLHEEYQDIDSTGVSAKMNNGVLELHLPKSPERQPRSIPVQGG